MKPERYLPKEAKDIFNRILKHLEENANSFPIDGLELSMLSMAFYQFADACKNGANEGFINKYKNDKGSTIQINGYQAQMNQAYSNILKHSPKFGLNTADREKIKAFSRLEKDEEDALDSL